MITGTCHFVSRIKAMEYYAGQYDWSDVPAIVDSKVSSGEIKIGPPQVNAAQKLLIIDNGTRYALQDTVQ